MADFSQWWWQAAAVDPGPGPGPGPDPGDPIGQSLRFRGATVNAYLNRTLSLNSVDWTFSIWLKYSGRNSGTYATFLGMQGGYSSIYPYPDGRLYVQKGASLNYQGPIVLRDSSAWYHFLYTRNGVYLNGEQISGTASTANLTTNRITLGNSDTANQRFDGYLAAVYFVDGQSLEPTAFGRYNTAGVWVPVDYSGSFGSNGFHLDFADPSNIGKDVANGNDFTATGFETVDTSSPDYDVMTGDSPTKNYATINPLYPSTDPPAGENSTDANLSYLGKSNTTGTQASTMAMPDTGKFYVEWTIVVFSDHQTFGVTRMPSRTTQADSGLARIFVSFGGGWSFFIDTTSVSSGAGIVAGDVIRMAYDTETGQILFWQNDNLLVDDTFNTRADAGTLFAFGALEGKGGNKFAVNYGQKPFLHTPPAGFEALQTQNLPAATIADGRAHFQAITGPGQGADSGVPGQLAGNWATEVTSSDNGFYTGQGPENMFDGSTATFAQTSTSSGVLTFTPATPINFTTKLEVHSSRDANQTHNLNGGPFINHGTDGTNEWWDVATGSGTLTSLAFAGTYGGSVQAIKVDGEILVDGNILALAQQTFPDGLWWIKDRVNANQHQFVDSVNGTSAVITCPAGSVTAYAAPAGSSVAWCWNAANTDGGFSITNGTHGLGATPAMVIDRALNVWHQSLPAGQGLVLKSSAAPTSQSWTVDGTTVSGPGGGSYYSWSEIPGYSAFGSYQGNNNDDGPFIYTGMKVGWVLVKGTNDNNWHMRDTTRLPTNPNDNMLYASLTDPESAYIGFAIDMLSNGFKIRGSHSLLNTSGQEYIYAAFAENPFQAPATAR